MAIAFRFVLLCALTCFPMFGLAEKMEEFRAPDVYQIEFVLFKHANPELDILEYEQLESSYSKPDPYAVLYPYGTEAPSQRSRALPRENTGFTLKHVLRRLNRSDQFDVLLSGKWSEEIDNDTAALPVLLQAPEKIDTPFFRYQGADNANFSAAERFVGYLQIKRSRYMHAHVRVDYQYLQPYAYRSLSDWFVAAEHERLYLGELLYPITPEDDEANDSLVRRLDSSPQVSRSFSLQQSRRIKDGEIHYIDHPFLGLVVGIKKLETDTF